MQYIGNVIRPPSEADSIILQVTVGCSYNRCTFCGVYKDIPFSIKPQKTILEDLKFASSHCRRQKRMFLVDGDVLILSQKKLIYYFQLINKYLPWVSRISLYGNAKAIRNKTVADLSELKELGLNRIYMGLESGCDDILQSVQKGVSIQNIIEVAKKVKECGIFLSVSVLLGLGGIENSIRHAIDTAKTLNQMEPGQIGALTYMPLDNTVLGQEVKNGIFTIPAPSIILQELYLLVNHLDLKRCQFHANHASNYLPIVGRLPRDKKSLLTSIDMALQGILPLVPEHKRAL